MALVIDVKNRQVMSMTVPRDDIEISNFRNYVLKVEGTRITSEDSKDKKLVIKIGSDGVLYFDIISSDKPPIDDFSDIIAGLPKGFEERLRTKANKIIRGVAGQYLYFSNSDREYIAYAVGPTGKAYKITLGKISDRNSKLRQVLDTAPHSPFLKVYFNNKLPTNIIENRQPIKAALDILEFEKYIKKTGKKIGISEEYERTSKVPPRVEN